MHFKIFEDTNAPAQAAAPQAAAPQAAAPAKELAPASADAIAAASMPLKDAEEKPPGAPRAVRTGNFGGGVVNPRELFNP